KICRKIKWLSNFVLVFLQNELEYGAEESPVSPRLPIQHQHSQTAVHGVPISSNPFASLTVGQGVRSGHVDHQAKNSVFSNALSSPVRRSLQHYHLAQGGYHSNVLSCPNGGRSNENQNRDANSPIANDCMDMHADSPAHDFSY
ncbi:uncharacterized protein LOC110808093, partial [Carica papaya]|uniref:uncharacterized protein LOC110808093 n=1 Tax=Carica papaya TaxID=3649 RepID=UPI000B8D0EDD